MRVRRGARRRLDRRGRRRRELARLRRLDARRRAARAGEPGADPRHGRRRAGAEHRRLRRRAAGPLRVARRGRPASPAAASRSSRDACAFGYRDSVFKHAAAPAGGSADHRGCAFACRGRGSRCSATSTSNARWPRPASRAPDARQIFDWVCAIRRAKLPDPARDRQRRQLLQEPDRHARAVPRHHRPRPGDRALPACPTAASSSPPAG